MFDITKCAKTIEGSKCISLKKIIPKRALVTYHSSAMIDMLIKNNVQPDNTKQIPVWPESCQVQPKLLLAEFVNIKCIFGVCNSSRPPFNSDLCSFKTPYCFLPFFFVHALFFLLLLLCLLLTVIWPSTDPGSDSCSAAQFLGPGPALKCQAIWAQCWS